jgi:ectoine hydroxylase-related dioxygenase (phytanoyl-CoA dioxygenase family)
MKSKTMKKNYLLVFMLMLFLSGINTLVAQSDYQTVQNFKKDVQEIEQAIKGAESTEEVESISGNIDRLSSKYAPQKKLLDNGLYPDNFEKTIQRLKSTNNLRQGDFTQITELKTTVTVLQGEIDTLKVRNDELSRQFTELEGKNSKRVAELEQVIAQLRSSILKRDQLLIDMINEMLPADYEVGDQLSSQEKQEIVSRAEKKNILSNIKKAVNDNIRFLDATRLYPADLRDVKSQYDNFTRIWNSAGSRIMELYIEKGKRADEVAEIKDAFDRWQSKINEEVWSSINDEFSSSNIHLSKFSNGNEFVSNISSYISEEIMNAEAKGEDKAKKEYENFDSTWSKKIKPSWMSFLLDNKMITQNEEDSIEVKLATWEDAVYPDKFNWLYIIIAVLVIALVVVLFLKRTPKKSESSYTNQ